MQARVRRDQPGQWGGADQAAVWPYSSATVKSPQVKDSLQLCLSRFPFLPISLCLSLHPFPFLSISLCPSLPPIFSSLSHALSLSLLRPASTSFSLSLSLSPSLSPCSGISESLRCISTFWRLQRQMSRRTFHVKTYQELLLESDPFNNAHSRICDLPLCRIFNALTHFRRVMYSNLQKVSGKRPWTSIS